jgi:hypothetical protein
MPANSDLFRSWDFGKTLHVGAHLVIESSESDAGEQAAGQDHRKTVSARYWARLRHEPLALRLPVEWHLRELVLLDPLA